MANETAGDLSVMVGIMGEAIADRNNLMSGEWAWQLAGRILCPIFDYAKPEDYITRMRAARQAYAGISSDEVLREAFETAVQALAEAGALDSLDGAIAGAAWQELESRAPILR